MNSHKGWMGCYLPKVSLMTRRDFEALGSLVRANEIPVWIEPRAILGPNDSQRRPATASSVEKPEHAASAAFDGNLTTRWTSAWNGDPQFLTVDLGQVKRISGVKLYWEFTLKASTYQLQVSADNRTWTPIFATTTGDGGIDLLTNLTATGRYVRVLMSAGTFPMYALHEMEVFSPDMPCTTATAPLGVSPERTQNQLRLWPNPARASVAVELPAPPDQAATVQVVDQTGRVWLTQSTTNTRTDLRIGTLPPGLYVVRVRVGNKTCAERLLVEK